MRKIAKLITIVSSIIMLVLSILFAKEFFDSWRFMNGLNRVLYIIAIILDIVGIILSAFKSPNEPVWKMGIILNAIYFVAPFILGVVLCLVYNLIQFRGAGNM